MPTSYSPHPQDIDPRRWRACLRQAEADMLAAGWNRHARKFVDVHLRKARKLWAKP